MRYQKLVQKSFLRILLASLLLCSFESSFAFNYYFSSVSGNDTYSSVQARNPATPWKSISKLNSYFSSLSAGDSVLFKRGEVFEGSVIVSQSGSYFAAICFGAYGQGSKPVLTGFATLSTWKSVGGGVYETSCTSDGTVLLVNGVQKAMGRYPNAGYLTYESHINNTSITDGQLSGSDWTGGEVVIRKNRWTMEKSVITSQSGGTLTYAAGTKANPTNNYGYFIQNHAKTLDQFGEWYYDASRKVMMVYFGSTNPSSVTVKTSTTNILVDIRSVGYIDFDGLAFTGAGLNAFKVSASKFIKIKNSSVQFTGAEALFVSYSPNFTFDNSTVSNSFGAFNLDAGCSNATVTNSKIKNIALIPGSGKSGLGIYSAMFTFGDNSLIEKNTFDSIGYNGIYLGGNSSTVKNNLIQYFCLVLDDGAGVYVGDWSKTYNKSIIGNIVLHGVGASAGTNSLNSLQAEGIYIDDLSESVTVRGNTVSLCANNGIKIHDASDIKILNNTIFNNGAQLRLEQDHYSSTSTYVRNIGVFGNTFFSRMAGQPVSKLSTHQDDLAMFGLLDSNYYCRPLDELGSITSYIVRGGKDINQTFDLAGWKTVSGKDIVSNTTPVAIPTYKVTSLIGSNKLPNGSFNTNVSGLYAYSTISDCNAVFAAGGMDGGALKLAFGVSTGNHAVINMNIGNITANKNYIVKFSLKGAANGKTLDTYLRKTGSPYNAISNIRTCKISSSRTENEFLLTSTTDITDASLIFEFDEPAGPIYIDNVQLHEATITTSNPDEYMLFEYNAGNSAKTVSLSRTYVDVKNKMYSGSVTLSPYSSIILIAVDPVISATKNSQTVSFKNAELKTYSNVPVAVEAVASSGLPVTLRVTSGPAEVVDNTVRFKDFGTATVEAVQSGNDKFEPASARIDIQNVSAPNSDAVKSSPAVLATTPSPSKQELKAFPNPFTNKLTLEFTVPVTGEGTLNLYDVQGRFIKQIFSGSIKSGEPQSFSILADNIGIVRGMYIIQLESGKKVLTSQKVVLAK